VDMVWDEGLWFGCFTAGWRVQVCSLEVEHAC
jgi:hypothetical protein